MYSKPYQQNNLIIEQPLIYSDLCPYGLILFPKIKTHLRDCYLGTTEKMEQVMMNQVKAVPVEDFLHFFICGNIFISEKFLKETILKPRKLICN